MAVQNKKNIALINDLISMYLSLTLDRKSLNVQLKFKQFGLGKECDATTPLR